MSGFTLEELCLPSAPQHLDSLAPEPAQLSAEILYQMALSPTDVFNHAQKHVLKQV